MTRRVDHDERRQRIGEALWRIAAARGLHDVGLREIAAEAGVSLGALQHYFADKGEVLAFALERVGVEATRRVTGRLTALGGRPAPGTVIRETLAEMLPVSPESRTGLLVNIAFLARAVHDPGLRAVTGQGVGPLRDLLAGQIRRAAETGGPGRDHDPSDEAMTLICLVDGVTTYVLLDALTVEEGNRLVEAHLVRVLGEGT